MRTLRLDIEYLGTRYQGWQVQPDRPTVQGWVETALSRVLSEPVRVTGAGRTDAGVHARGQVASVTTRSAVPLRGVVLGANHHLPEDIRIRAAREAPAGFHARHDAVGKDYAYRYSTAAVLSPFLAERVESVRGILDHDRMARAAVHFLGEHDYHAFCSAEGRRKNTLRRVTESRFDADPDGVSVYRISARSFLQYMVRTVMGTLFEVGRGRIDPDSIPAILASRDRARAGPTAAGRGLTLEAVHYPPAMEFGAGWPGAPC